MMVFEIKREAAQAIRAASSHWGRYATRRYLEKRRVHPSLYRLAKQLEAARKAGI